MRAWFRLRQSLDALRNRGILREHDDGRLREVPYAGGFLRLLPGAFGTDGFFIAMLEETAGTRVSISRWDICHGSYSSASFSSA